MFEDIKNNLDDININTIYNLDDIYNGSTGAELPSEFCLNSTPIQDQRKYKYQNGCTRAAASHTFNEQAVAKKTNGDTLWTYAVEHGLGSAKSGSSMTSAILQTEAEGLHSGRASVDKTNTHLIKSLIYQVRPFYTGSNRIDWVAMAKAKTNKAIISSGEGHMFCLVGWSDPAQEWIIRDSRGPEFRGDGHFRLAYSDIQYLYTLINFVTPTEQAQLKLIKDEQMKQLAITNKIINGKDLLSKVTREQLAIMIGRIKYGLLEDSELLLKTKEIGIWNGLNPGSSVTREHSLLMFGRLLGYTGTDSDIIQQMKLHGYTNANDLQSLLTREQSAIMAGRVLVSK